MKARFAAALLISLALGGCRRQITDVRIGYEMNLASAPAMLGVARGDFQKALALPVQAMAFNAGPGVADALFTRKLDFAYLDPVSAIGVYVRSKGRYVIIAGSALGGGALVVAPDVANAGLEGLRDARVATPQVGSGADVAARHYFLEKGFVSKEQGGGFQIVPIANLDVVRVFQRQDVSGAWTVEPWVAALEQEAGAVVLVAQSDPTDAASQEANPTGVVIARQDLVRRHPELVARFLAVHAALVDDLNQDRAGSRSVCIRQLTTVTGRPFGGRALERAWARVSFSTETPVAAVVRQAYEAFRIGFLGASVPDLKPAFYEAPSSKPPRSAG